MNERNTEQIVEDYLKKNFKIDQIEILRHPKIKGASKNIPGNIGRPDYLIKFINKPNRIIVIECKNLAKKIQKAIKEVQNYSQHLNSKYNQIVAIAIAGQENNFISKTIIQNKIVFEEMPSEKEINNYFLPKPDIKSLKKVAKEINNYLQNFSIDESERLSLISAAILSLQVESFANTLKDHIPQNNEGLVENVLTSCKQQLKKSEIEEKNIKEILKSLKNIEKKIFTKETRVDKKNKEKEVPNNILKDFLIRINDEVKPYFQNNYFDVLAEFYNEFIRYARGDQKKGLVLTPPHIAKFMVEAIEINKNSVVLDPCCGTGAFLVAAMNQMLTNTTNFKEKDKIKKTQLIGVEIRNTMFTAVAINMVIHGDGKSNLINGDCFSKQVKNEIMLKKPTHGLLNPPYDGGPEDQLDFIKNTLDQIEVGGKVAAIVSSSVGVNSKKEYILKKEKVLKSHTLLASLKMPKNLFKDVGVETIILIFKAHSPHKGKTYFGNYDDDGFKVLKHIGRMKTNKTTKIIEKWLYNLKYLKYEEGFSFLQEVDYKMEWHPSAYIETNYKALEQMEEWDYIKNKAIELFKKGIIDEIKKESFFEYENRDK